MTSTVGFQYVDDTSGWKPSAGMVVPVSRRIRDKRDLMGRWKQTFQLPGYFGANWDALNDCLHDLAWMQGIEDITLLHDGLPFGRGAMKTRRLYLRLLQGLLETTNGEPPRWTVVFPESCRETINELLSDAGEGVPG